MPPPPFPEQETQDEVWIGVGVGLILDLHVLVDVLGLARSFGLVALGVLVGVFLEGLEDLPELGVQEFDVLRGVRGEPLLAGVVLLVELLRALRDVALLQLLHLLLVVVDGHELVAGVEGSSRGHRAALALRDGPQGAPPRVGQEARLELLKVEGPDGLATRRALVDGGPAPAALPLGGGGGLVVVLLLRRHSLLEHAHGVSRFLHELQALPKLHGLGALVGRTRSLRNHAAARALPIRHLPSRLPRVYHASGYDSFLHEVSCGWPSLQKRVELGRVQRVRGASPRASPRGHCRRRRCG
mmetsp:Transcript_11795/g.29842  ORF Transcript_11795/g.29842 Transcript_11795/m.29842 type:complete len:299 (-) Transcript_11795:61-957(-)